jgi:hypothetical protein
MTDRDGIRIGSMWSSTKDGSIIVVVSKHRSGHQYDRYYMCECLVEAGIMIDIEDYMIYLGYTQAGEEDDKTAI